MHAIRADAVRAVIFDFDGLLMAGGRLSLSGAAAVAVEDTGHGVAAVHAAGMRCIAIPNPFVALERVRDADLVLSSASQLRLADALGQLS